MGHLIRYDTLPKKVPEEAGRMHGNIKDAII
jgi:hypothetical protein